MHVQLNLVYPLICTDRLTESRDFYHRHFGFDVVFEADWYVHMERRDADGGAHQIAFILPDHETLPPAYRRLTAGLVVSLEFNEVDALYEKMRHAGARIAQDLRDEEFGQRHFMAEDPNGLLIDIIKLIPPSEEFIASVAASSVM